jgi:hypothetical protein
MSEPSAHGPTCLADLRESIFADMELNAAQAWLERFGPLLTAAELDRGPALFVSRAGAASRFRTEQFVGGRDATYIVVTRIPERNKLDSLPEVIAPTAFRETIGYGPQVSGTDLIYDLADETLQGKARPFVCGLTDKSTRIYAILPVQMEGIALEWREHEGQRRLSADFHDASGGRLQALLPLHFRLAGPDGSLVKSGYYATEIDGRFTFPPPLFADLPAGCNVTVRSQLTGREESLEL